MAQGIPPDLSRRQESVSVDSSGLMSYPFLGDSAFFQDSLYQARPALDTTGVVADTASAAEQLPAGDTLSVSIYQSRLFISKGPADEIKRLPTYFLSQPGPIGSPAIPFDYINTLGADVTINGLPFPYNGIYRPYVIGVDLNTIPWEILNKIEANPLDGCLKGLNFITGPPADRLNRSDVEVSRGPYGYSGTRWRFFRPFGKKTYAYFTLGFKKSNGFMTNTDYNGHHVTGGFIRKLAGGELSLDLWTHRARAGLPAFDFTTPQQSRQSRTLTRSELRFKRSLMTPLFLSVTGLYHRTDQTITGYNSRLSTKYDIAGGEALLTDSLAGPTLAFGAGYYRGLIYGLPGNRPQVNHFSVRAGMENKDARPHYAFNLGYEWNLIDKGAVVPSIDIEYDLSGRLISYIMAYRARGIPDLYVRNLSDHVLLPSASVILRSYAFAPEPNLDTPLISQLTSGTMIDLGRADADLGISYKKIESQIYTLYTTDSDGNLTVAPANFNDSYIECFGTIKAGLWIFASEFGGSLRFWNDKYLPGGQEKGPKALGYGRVSARKEIFIPELFIGGSLDSRFTSRRDYRSIIDGSTDAFVSINGRLEFQYKDLVFWLNDENILNENYITWWPYYESPRIVWWGFKWSFFD